MDGSADSVRHVVGVMTGTSIDGIDAALVRVDGERLALRARLVRHRSESLDELREDLRRAAAQEPMSAGGFATLAWRFGELHAEVISRLLHPHPDPPPQRGSGHTVELIAVHGQTVFHKPPISWQLINPAPIAARFDCPVIFDLRQADLVAGGQGAPITPLADWILFRDETVARAIINLGGFCNVTIIPRQQTAASSVPGAVASDLQSVLGFDVCACNQILDAVALRVLGVPFDNGGIAARSGRAKPQAAEALRGILEAQRHGGRSLGTGDEAAAWIEQFSDRLAPNDLAASAADAIASCIAHAIAPHDVDEIILAGGGARNAALVNAIREKCSLAVRLSDELGVPIAAREAMAIAILGALSLDGVPITLPQVTGCEAPAPIGGVICPAPRRMQKESPVRT